MLAALGSIDYWFVTEGRRVHKTVHHYLMRFLGGELSDEDLEVTEVAWVPLTELPSRLAYADERRLAEVAGELIDKLHADGPAALPPLPRIVAAPSAPRRTRTPATVVLTKMLNPARPPDERLRTGTVTSAALLRALAALILLALGALPVAVPRAAAAEPGSTPFLQVRVDRVTPDVVTTTSEPTVTVTGAVLNVGDRPVRDVVVRLEDAPAVTTSTGLRTNLTGDVDQFEPVADFVPLSPELARGQRFRSFCRTRCARPTNRRSASMYPACTP